MQFQWYPGHMTKAKRQMQEDIKLVDLVIELVDARIPVSSRNPDIDTLGKGKARLILLNKSDLADERKNEGWTEFFKKKGYYVVRMDARNKGSMKQVSAIIAEACKEKTERDLRRGIKNRPVRAMVVGIPNVGKSTFINKTVGKTTAKTGDKPGVTKGKQWIRIKKDFELLDTPHRVQGKADLYGIIDPAHFFRGEVPNKSLDTALVAGEDLFGLNNGWLQLFRFHQTMSRLCSFLFCLTCQSRNDQSR